MAKGKLEQRIKRIFPCINSEIKSLALISLNKGASLWKSEIRTAALEHLHEISLEYNYARTFETYCERIFIPRGIVEKTGSGFRLTEFGHQYAMPIAKFALYYAANAGWSLSQFFGESGPKKDGSANAIYLFRKIKNAHERGETTSLAKLSLLTGLTASGIQNHIKRFKNIKTFKKEGSSFIEDRRMSLVYYTSLSPFEEGQINYMWVSGKSPEIFKQRDINCHISRDDAEKIVRLIYSSKTPISISDISSHIALKSKRMRKATRAFLNKLDEKGYIIRIARWNCGEKYSEIGLSKDGINFYMMFLDPIITGLEKDGKAMEELRALGERVFDSKEQFSQYPIDDAIRLYQATRPKRKIPFETKIKLINELLADRAMTRVSLLEAIEERIGNKINLYRIERAMPTLRKYKIEGKSNSVIYYLEKKN